LLLKIYMWDSVVTSLWTSRFSNGMNAAKYAIPPAVPLELQKSHRCKDQYKG
jgi:hypothetical protein